MAGRPPPLGDPSARLPPPSGRAPSPDRPPSAPVVDPSSLSALSSCPSSSDLASGLSAPGLSAQAAALAAAQISPAPPPRAAGSHPPPIFALPAIGHLSSATGFPPPAGVAANLGGTSTAEVPFLGGASLGAPFSDPLFPTAAQLGSELGAAAKGQQSGGFAMTSGLSSAVASADVPPLSNVAPPQDHALPCSNGNPGNSKSILVNESLYLLELEELKGLRAQHRRLMGKSVAPPPQGKIDKSWEPP